MQRGKKVQAIMHHGARFNHRSPRTKRTVIHTEATNDLHTTAHYRSTTHARTQLYPFWLFIFCCS
eukprot:1839473-Pyramimonas_sp.AAC.1